MTTAVLSLGSNLGDSLGYLRAAVRELETDVRSVSSVYRTPPWGPVPQDDFLNITVIVSNDAVDADGWLRRCQDLEAAAHRERPVRWGPRTLDADVVAVWQRIPGAGSADRSAAGGARHGTDVATAGGGFASAGSAEGSAGGASASAWHGDDAVFESDTEPVVSADPVLTLPHPRAHERAFVLVPWAEIQPDAVLPGHGPIAALLAGLDVSGILRVGGLDAETGGGTS